MMTPDGKRQFVSDVHALSVLLMVAALAFSAGVWMAKRGPVEVTHKVQCTMEVDDGD